MFLKYNVLKLPVMLNSIWTQADTWQQVITTHAGDQKNHFTALFSLMEGCISSQRVINYFSAVTFVVKGNKSLRRLVHREPRHSVN